jgi:uncharacterized membrane protein YeiH
VILDILKWIVCLAVSIPLAVFVIIGTMQGVVSSVGFLFALVAGLFEGRKRKERR